MTEELKKIIKEEIGSLPKEGQEAIGSVDWVKITEEIGKEYSLSEDELTDFQTETLLVLIGSTDPEFYAVNIENHAEVTKEMAEKMSDEVSEKIFTPILDKLEENIKKNVENNPAKPEQTLNFILSGGNYGAFLEQKNPEATETPKAPQTPKAPVNPVPPTLAEIQASVRKTSTLPMTLPVKPKI